MTQSVIGLLGSREAAQRVRGALVEAGCGKDSVAIFGQEAGDGIVQDLVGRGLKAERARLYAEAVGRGGVLVGAEAEDTDTVLAVMDRFDEKEPEELLERGNEQVERAQSIEEELRVGTGAPMAPRPLRSTPRTFVGRVRCPQHRRWSPTTRGRTGTAGCGSFSSPAGSRFEARSTRT